MLEQHSPNGIGDVEFRAKIKPARNEDIASLLSRVATRPRGSGSQTHTRAPPLDQNLGNPSCTPHTARFSPCLALDQSAALAPTKASRTPPKGHKIARSDTDRATGIIPFSYFYDQGRKAAESHSPAY